MTFSPMQAVLSSKDTKLGRGAGKLIDHGTRFCEGPNKSRNSSRSALALLLIPHFRPRKAQGPPGLLILARGLHCSSDPLSFAPCDLHPPKHTQVVALSSRAPGHGHSFSILGSQG